MNDEKARKLVRIAREASELIKRVYDAPFGVDYKAPDDPVTAADRGANELICRRLREEFSGTPIVAEESDPDSFEHYRTSDRIFFVDPVDGTREFIAKNGEFVTMIGYVVDKSPQIGVIHAPALDTTFVGIVGEGAYVIGPDGEKKPLRVSSVSDVSRATLVVSRSHRNEALERALAALGAGDVMSVGSAGLKGSRVASGAAEAYVSPGYSGKRWDACATEALVVAAGGKFTDAYGELIDYRSAALHNDRGVLASNGALHDTLLQGLERVRKLDA